MFSFSELFQGHLPGRTDKQEASLSTWGLEGHRKGEEPLRHGGQVEGLLHWAGGLSVFSGCSRRRLEPQALISPGPRGCEPEASLLGL